jgi:diaminopropionate ammonia-lyase
MVDHMNQHQTIPAFQPDPARPLALLAACPVYQPTAVLQLAGPDGGPLLVKDETNRMNLGAFKALGGVYAVARLIDEAWVAAGHAPLQPQDYMKDEVRNFASSMTFVCASAGNHGMAVAAGARIFGAKARIFLAKDVPAGFETRLRERQGAEVVRAGDTYEESVEAAKHNAQQTGAILLADGSWPGYVHPPSLVMEGYTAMAEELREHFEAAGQWPSHVFLQAGVGGIAGAITHMIRANWAVQPHIIIVEPDAAPCLLESHKAGKPVAVSGPSSNMGRLDCKEPSIIAHGIMQRCDVDFILVSDAEAAEAAAWLGRHGLATTPSGAAGLAGLVKHGACALPLVIVTEGAV